ncbi:hypothetical protein KSF73_02585 [Burkholderiaceae bacterium DAT-1]|nr:hypothetical protein [Burkholderiaceae bacterium DAT-1]
MKSSSPLRWTLCGLLAITGIVHADPQADAILAQARQASGGKAWDTLNSLEMEASAQSSAMGQFAYRIKVSLTTAPREIAQIEMGPLHVSWAWDGQQGWNTDPAGSVQMLQQPAEIKERRTAVFGDAYGYFFTDRIPSERRYLGKRTIQHTAYDVVSVTPAGGAAIELLVNERTHLIEGQIGTIGEPIQRQRFSDFRTVNGMLVPFQIESLNAANDTPLDRTTVKAYRPNVAVSDADFAAPTQPARTADQGTK